jgi:hypothetical protein
MMKRRQPMNPKRAALVPLIVASAISIAYIFVFGVDWKFTFQSGTVASAIFTGSILSAWASVPYLMLLPIARKEARPPIISTLAALIMLIVGMYWMDVGRHTPGDEGGSFIVVPLKQMLVAALIVLGWRGIRRAAR